MYGTTYTTCIGGCDPLFNESLNIKADSISNVSQGNDSGYRSTFDGSSSSAGSNTPAVRNNGIRQPRVAGNRTNLSENNTSVGLVRNQNRNRNDTSRSRNNSGNARKRNAPKNDKRNDTKNFNSEYTDLGLTNGGQGTSWGDLDNDAVIVCKCNENAIQLTVRKEGPNQGKDSLVNYVKSLSPLLLDFTIIL